jgi:hydroxymethylpyrimidine/phosphomethylpyrimidine kinase
VTRRRVALSVAGSDSSGGAGIPADLKTWHALGVHGCCAVTAVTAQSSVAVDRLEVLSADLVAAQIRAVLDDVEVDVVKTGMLGNATVVEAVGVTLADYDRLLVVDPVIAATTGAVLLDASGVAAMRELLLPRATVVTPNLHELELLGGLDALLATGVAWVLVTGGHRSGRPVDVLTNGSRSVQIDGERVAAPHAHGGGCTFAAALAAYLALEEEIEQAARLAKAFVTAALRAGYPAGRGAGPVDQGWARTEG